MMKEQVETLVIGAGQAGLAMSHMLTQRGCEHLVLERRRIAERWRAERWDGLRFQFPNWSVRLPDFPLRHCAPDEFATSREIVDFLVAYAGAVAAPVCCGVAVTQLRCRGDRRGFAAETTHGLVEAANVVVATGPYQRPIIPALLDPAVGFQLHASRYVRPEQLPPGAVLIIGSGASGVQIAEELVRAGRHVYLSVGHHRRMPRRYRGRDLMWWLCELGLDQTPVERRGPDRSLPLITGAYGGHTIDFRNLAKQGVRLLGHAKAAHDGWLDFAPDLAATLAHGDATYAGFLEIADAHVAHNALDMPQDPTAHATLQDPPTLSAPVGRLDLRSAGIGSVIWATGYCFDFSWIDIPVLDVDGNPIHRRGVTNVTGLYFLGLPWLSRMNSSFLSGVGQDAAELANYIAGEKSGRRSNADDFRRLSTGAI